MTINSALHREILDFLINIPVLHTEKGRRALLLSAGLKELKSNIDCSGTVKVFVSLLIEQLDSYGVLLNGEDALISFLKEIESEVGLNHKETLQSFRERIKKHREDSVSPDKLTGKEIAKTSDTLLDKEFPLEVIATLPEGKVIPEISEVETIPSEDIEDKSEIEQIDKKVSQQKTPFKLNKRLLVLIILSVFVTALSILMGESVFNIEIFSTPTGKFAAFFLLCSFFIFIKILDIELDKYKKHSSKLYKFLLPIAIILILMAVVLISKCSKPPSINNEIESDNYRDWLNKGDTYYNQDNYIKAFECYSKANEIKPDDADALYSIGNVCEKLDNNDEAIKYHTKAAVSWYNMGLEHAKQGNYTESIKPYNKATEIKPNYDHFWYSKGLAHDELGEYDEARKCYKTAIEIKPDAYAWNEIGTTYAKQGKYDEARKCYKEVREINSDYDDALNNIGNTYREQGNYDEAIKYYNKAIDINPNYAIAWNNKGLAYDKKGNYTEAIKCLKKAIEIKPNAKTWYNMGIAYEKQGNQAEADRCFKKAKELGY